MKTLDSSGYREGQWVLEGEAAGIRQGQHDVIRET